MNQRVSNTRQLAVLAQWSSCLLFLLAKEVTCGCLAKGVKLSAANDLSLSTRQLTPPDKKCDWRHSIVNRKKKKKKISIQFHHLVWFWHQSAAHQWCTYAHLGVTQRYNRKLIWVSQSAADCFIRHVFVFVYSALSLLGFSFLSLRPVQPTLCLFHIILTISQAKMTQI